jgi:hypothetical protein
MFRNYFTNLFFFQDGEFATLDEALVAGKSAGFCFSVQRNGEVVAGWDIIGGTRLYR